MITFNYVQDGQTKFDAFEDILSLTYFVAANKIKDEDFVSMQYDDNEPIEGIDGLREFVMNNIIAMTTRDDDEDTSEEDEEEEKKACQAFFFMYNFI